MQDFSQTRDRQKTAKVGYQPIILANFPQKLHKNETFWTWGVSLGANTSQVFQITCYLFPTQFLDPLLPLSAPPEELKMLLKDTCNSVRNQVNLPLPSAASAGDTAHPLGSIVCGSSLSVIRVPVGLQVLPCRHVDLALYTCSDTCRDCRPETLLVVHCEGHYI